MSIDHSHEELTNDDPNQFALDFGIPEAEAAPAEATNELAAFEGAATPDDASALFPVEAAAPDVSDAVTEVNAIPAVKEPIADLPVAPGPVFEAPAKEAEAPAQAPTTVPAEKKGFHLKRWHKITASVAGLALAAGAAGVNLLNRGGSVEATGATPVATSPANSAPSEGSSLPAETNGSVTITSEATAPATSPAEVTPSATEAPATTVESDGVTIQGPETDLFVKDVQANVLDLIANASEGEVTTIPNDNPDYTTLEYKSYPKALNFDPGHDSGLEPTIVITIEGKKGAGGLIGEMTNLVVDVSYDATGGFTVQTYHGQYTKTNKGTAVVDVNYKYMDMSSGAISNEHYTTNQNDGLTYITPENIDQVGGQIDQVVDMARKGTATWVAPILG